MNVIKTSIDGVIIIEPRIFKDTRGYFLSLLIRRNLRKKSVVQSLYKIMKVNLVMVLSVVYIFRNHLLPKVN